MSNPIYSKTNYRKNITLYWQQYLPEYEIPKGYHVHHIKPRCICKQEGWSDEQINHPRNLIVVHPVEHWTLHYCRGDKIVSEFTILAGWDKDRIGKKISKALKKINPKTGLSKGQECALKSANTMKIKDKNGLSIYDKSAIKIRKKSLTKNPESGLTPADIVGAKCYKTRMKINSATGLNSYEQNGINQLGEKNPLFKGWYITPLGKFVNKKEAALMLNLGVNALFSYCKKSERVITHRIVSRSKSKHINEASIGKTFNDIGFGFLKK